MAVPVISIEQMREWETAAWAAGKTEQEVIKRVGQAVAATALSLTGAKDRVLILAGKGHNGDDARAAREHLAGRQVELLEASDPVAAAAGLEAALNPPPDLVIDGLFGIGLNRSLSDEWIHFIERVNSGGCTVLAVDVPSGLDADTGQHFGAAIHGRRHADRWSAQAGVVAGISLAVCRALEVAAGGGAG
jgi:NAD(P)H-hydrate repair Nnr-like enzyme with NAD(P)H-hydrate epimerase domain